MEVLSGSQVRTEGPWGMKMAIVVDGGRGSTCTSSVPLQLPLPFSLPLSLSLCLS